MVHTTNTPRRGPGGRAKAHGMVVRLALACSISPCWYVLGFHRRDEACRNADITDTSAGQSQCALR